VRKIILALITSLLFVTMPFEARACTQRAAEATGAHLKKQRTAKRKVVGSFVLIDQILVSSDEESGDIFRNIGRIKTRSGKIFETVHFSDNMIVLCGRAQGPIADATGTFYLERKLRDGRFEIYDWQGDYVTSAKGNAQ
jgi:hypothetical protein